LELLTDLFFSSAKGDNVFNSCVIKLYAVESLSLVGCVWLAGPEASEGPGTWT